ncbi:HNH endonuclease [Thiohalospira halophila DSM 15071]|uniref:HNH endonuclease n=1 Tax=Thiohalospira halophila DSM 15071 TaxID=1123397 RepID=A0A1I1NDB9_9GAMM|nr:RNA-guided endonuclease IscB [Thiohalospira halophila]SFC95475.1 HNH endonuclease [Thiohalospira halophila DSM 15071]
MQQQRVFVQGREGSPLMPCHPARARRLLRVGRAKVVRRVPFTVRLIDRDQKDSAVQPVSLRLDPGARTTGVALVAEGGRGARAVWAAELTHRSQSIRSRLTDRRMYRRGRRSRKTRHRPPRLQNRARPKGWLPPSLQSRVDNTRTWAERLACRAPVSTVVVETTRFDVHALSAGKPLAGVEYQQGTLQGWELREYLLHRHGHTCAYCQGESRDPVLEVEHVHPRSRGGSNRVANLVIACQTCNTAKGNRTPGEWAVALGRTKFDQARAKTAPAIEAGKPSSLRDAAAMNASRYAVGRAVKTLGLPVTFTSGGRTKANRSSQGYRKAHWIDAACVGPAGDSVHLDPNAPVLSITATGRGQRRVTKPDRYGFPRGAAGRVKRVQGLQTGDRVRAVVPTGKYRGSHVGRVAGVRADGRMDVATTRQKFTTTAARLARLQAADGYHYEGAGL